MGINTWQSNSKLQSVFIAALQDLSLFTSQSGEMEVKRTFPPKGSIRCINWGDIETLSSNCLEAVSFTAAPFTLSTSDHMYHDSG
jgi:hypothetical protein